MANTSQQSFIIHRHGARYPLQRPKHNISWPKEKSFWDCHIGGLTPVGVLQMNKLGYFFEQRYNWITTNNTQIWSTHRSRALESAWSFVLGLLPDSPVMFNCLRDEKIELKDNVCYINYYHRKYDTLFGSEDPSMIYKLNVNESTLLQKYSQDERVKKLISRLSSEGKFRLRRDEITTTAKLKEIYSQILIDQQLQVPLELSLVTHYGLNEEEIQLINDIGCEVMCRRLVPSNDLLTNNNFNKDQGMGLVQDILSLLDNWSGKNELKVYSCHDTNMIAFMSILGLKISPPGFAGYILLERTKNYNTNMDTLEVYYCQDPFGGQGQVSGKLWHMEREMYMDWDDLPDGVFATREFVDMVKNI